MKLKFIPLLALGAILFGCKAISKVDGIPPSTVKTFQLSPTSFESQSSDDAVGNISAYVFSRGTFVKAFNDIEKDDNGNIAIAIPAGSELFFLTNTAPPASYDALKEGQTSLDDFLTFTTASTDSHTQTRAPEFFSGRYKVSDQASESGITTVSLARSVARLDVDASRDELIKVKRLVVESANTITKLFAGTTSAPLSEMSYEQTFEPEMDGIRSDIFRIYESSTPVRCTLYGTYNAMPIVIPITIPVVERNMIYTLRILNAGTSITGSFEVIPWGDGGSVDGLPDVNEKIKISEQNTQLTTGVTADYQTNVVDVCSDGGEFTLGFVGVAEIELASISGAHAQVKVDRVSAEATVSGVVTKYNVTVDAQGKGRLPYTVTLNMKSVLSTNVYDQVSINVAQSPYQIAEVTLGGKTWMAFNARTRNLDDQVYLLDGATVKNMYDNNWIATIGGLFQWGRQYMYTPWLSGSSNSGNQAQNNPWVDHTHVPCPDGYRIPTKAELRALLPPGQSIPGSYSYNDETIDIALHTATQANVSINNVRGTAKYITLTSTSSAEQLIIPLAGFKGDASSSNNPGFGSNLVIWASDRAGATSGWAWISKFIGNSNQIEPNNSQLQCNGYAYVRCIKK